MARLVFPGSPSNGDKHEHAGKIFQYLARKNRWDAVGTTAVSATKAEELETRLATIETEGSGTGTEAVANASSLSLSGLEAGAMAFDQENNRLYITNGSGWYSIALINSNPSITANVESVELGASGNTVLIGYTVVEPEGTPVTVSVSNSGISNTSQGNVVHYSSNNTIEVNNFAAEGGEWSGTVTLTVSDGVNLGTDSFTLNVAYSKDFELIYTMGFTDSSVKRSPNRFYNFSYANDYGNLSPLADWGAGATTNPVLENNAVKTDFGIDALSSVDVRIIGGMSGRLSSSDQSTSWCGLGSTVEANIDLDALFAAYGHRKIWWAIGASGGASGVYGENASGGGASAVFTWTGGSVNSGTMLPLIVAGGGGGPTNVSGGGNKGGDAWMPTSNYTTYQQYNQFGTDPNYRLDQVTSSARPWGLETGGPTSTGAAAGASWDYNGNAHESNYAEPTYMLRNQFNNTDPQADGNNISSYHGQRFGGGGAGAFGGGGGGGYFGGFHGDYHIYPNGGWGGQGYIDTSYVTLLDHRNVFGTPYILFKPEGTFPI